MQSLPPEYAGIFRFEDFRGVETKIRGYIKALRARHQRELVDRFTFAPKKASANTASANDDVETETIADTYAVAGKYVAIILKDVPVAQIQKLHQERAVVRCKLERQMFPVAKPKSATWITAWITLCDRLFPAFFLTSSGCPLCTAE